MSLNLYTLSLYKYLTHTLDSILKCKTWILVNLSRGGKSMGCKWVFRKRYNPNYSIDKFIINIKVD